MAADDEQREKQRRRRAGASGGASNEMMLAIGVACLLATFIFLAARSATKPSALSARPRTRPSSASSGPSVSTAGHGRPAGDGAVPLPQAAPLVGADGKWPEDRAPWPYCCGKQPPVANPYLDAADGVLPASAEAAYADFTREKMSIRAELDTKWGDFCDDITTKWPGDMIVHDCWSAPQKGERGEKLELPYGAHRIPTCNVSGHCWDNRSNWDIVRIDQCKHLNEEFAKKVPQPPRDFLEYVNLRTEHTWPSGDRVGELGFDPSVVRDHFFRAQAALCVYTHGCAALTGPGPTAIRVSGKQLLRPTPYEPEYEPFLEALSARFAAAFLRGGSFVVSAMGDSTLAGADNCYHDNWLDTLGRQLKPLFKAAGVDFVTRNCGHNGGWGAFDQMSCAYSSIGTDSDVAHVSWPFVRPQEVDEMFTHELFIRRALATGILPHVTGVFDGNLENTETPTLYPYVKYGVGFGPVGFSTYSTNESEMQQWWPATRRSEYGRVGDGECHADETRSGGAPVLFRNWHPGPMGHQVHADQIAFLYMSAATHALSKIQADLAASGGKVAPLLAKYRGRDAVKDAVKTWPDKPLTCRRACVEKPKTHFDKTAKLQPSCPASCSGKGAGDREFPVCLMPLAPLFGTGWSDWVVESMSPGFKVRYDRPRSDPQKHPPPQGQYGGVWSLPGIWEPFVTDGRCEHFDSFMNVDMGNSSVVFCVPKGTMRRGTVSGAVFCGLSGMQRHRNQLDGLAPWDPKVSPVVSVQIGSTNAKVQRRELRWLDEQEVYELEGENTWTIAPPLLPTDKDVYVHVDCSSKQSKGLITKFMVT